MVLQVSENHCLSALASTVGEASERSPLHKSAHWTGAIEVEVKTLDTIAATHGAPDFVKIDAEGYDDHVLAGMSFAPRVVSFEYYKYLPDVAHRCMTAPVFTKGYEFNYAQGTALRLASPNWMSAADLRVQLEALASSGLDYGDVMARRLTGAAPALG
jgi:hypothetical protein